MAVIKGLKLCQFNRNHTKYHQYPEYHEAFNLFDYHGEGLLAAHDLEKALTGLGYHNAALDEVKSHLGVTKHSEVHHSSNIFFVFNL